MTLKKRRDLSPFHFKFLALEREEWTISRENKYFFKSMTALCKPFLSIIDLSKTFP